MDITYDVLITPEGHCTVYDFLELSPTDIDPAITRQHPGSQRDKIQNYDDVKAHFAGTRWADQFLD